MIPKELLQALTQAFDHKAAGRHDQASAWAAELCRLLQCTDVINIRGRELRRDYHVGPQDVIFGVHL